MKERKPASSSWTMTGIILESLQEMLSPEGQQRRRHRFVWR
ncbi:MAG: hypothetical protein R3E58_14280 [Phycisphaerae bacterium]